MTNQMNEFNRQKRESLGNPAHAGHVRDIPLDLLITRLADGDGDDAEWAEFQRRAAESREPWQHLAEQQYISRKLREGFDRVTRQAMLVELPDDRSVSDNINHHHHLHHRSDHQAPDAGVDRGAAPARSFSLSLMAGRYGGWAAAAIIVLAWMLTMAFDSNARPNDRRVGPIAVNQPDQAGGAASQPQAANSVSVDVTPDGYLQKYLEEAPHVVREMPPLLLQARISKDGQEVIYMRRIIEHRKTSGLFQITRDEHNNEVLVPRSLNDESSSRMY